MLRTSIRSGRNPFRIFAIGIGCAMVLGLVGPAGAQNTIVLDDTRSSQRVTPQDLLRDMLAGTAPLILDVRPAVHFARGHIPGAYNVPHKQLPGRFDEIAPHKDRGVVVYCQKGLRTRASMQAFSQFGLRRLGVLDGFFDEWERLDYPVTHALP